MRLSNLKDLNGEVIDIFLSNGMAEDDEIIFENAIALPGLINSHDHLEFNLFPSYGNKKYSSYTEWGKHLQQEYKNEIKKVLKIPVGLRVEWGLYKNLLCGVTTVVNHGTRLHIKDPVISVYQHTQNLHSVQFEKFWKLKLNNPLRRKQTCAIHVGEGIDEKSHNEIDALVKWNCLKKDIVGIHGVAMKKEQSQKFKAIVWCPASNYFLFNATASINELNTKILFGTDSTLTAHWNIWEHLRLAKEKTAVSNGELFKMVTTNPAEVWKIPGYSNGQKLPADIVIARASKTFPVEDFSAFDPQGLLMVIHKSKIVLFDNSIHGQFGNGFAERRNFYPIQIGEEIKWVKGNLPQVMRKIKEYNPEQSFPVQTVDK